MERKLNSFNEHQVLGELHFYGLHSRDERQLFKGFTLLWSSSNKKPEFFEKNSGFCALGIIIPSLRKYDYFRRLAILSSAIWIICLTISPPTFPLRSEEHTSELQSRFDLVC